MSDAAVKPSAPKVAMRKPKYAPPKKKQPPAVLSSEKIAEQTEAFLKAGGTIEVIRSGVSGRS